MKLVLSIIAIILITGLAQFIAPWWILVPIVAIITAAFSLKPWQGLLAGLAGITLLWAFYAFMLDGSNNSIMSTQMGNLLGGLSPILMVLVSALIGGIVGGLAGLTGSYGRGLISSDENVVA